HKLESWATLAFELLCPVLIFTPRWGRLAAFAVFTTFQIVNIATANYGFFSYLALVLGVFLLDDTAVVWLSREAPHAIRKAMARLTMPRSRGWALVVERVNARDRQGIALKLRTAAAVILVAIYIGVSAQEASGNFWRGGPRSEALVSLAETLGPYRIVNTY